MAVHQITYWNDRGKLDLTTVKFERIADDQIMGTVHLSNGETTGLRAYILPDRDERATRDYIASELVWMIKPHIEKKRTRHA